VAHLDGAGQVHVGRAVGGGPGRAGHADEGVAGGGGGGDGVVRGDLDDGEGRDGRGREEGLREDGAVHGSGYGAGGRSDGRALDVRDGVGGGDVAALRGLVGLVGLGRAGERERVVEPRALAGRRELAELHL